MKEPKIRFKGFKGEWENTPFSETFDSLKNNSLSRAELSDSGEVMNIHYGDVLIKYGECVDVIKEVETFVKDEEVAKKLHQSCAIKNGDVIFADAAEDNTVGKCSEVIANENDAIVSGLHTIACRPKKDFAPMYLGYYLNSNTYHDQLLPHIQGTKISSISKKAISQTEISSPIDKNEQQSIASYFQHLDSLIQSTTKKIESLKQVKAASLQSMFPQEGETTPRVRFKGFEGEWEKVLIGKMGVTYSGLSGKTKDDFGFGEARFITFLNVLTNAKIDTSILEPVNVNRDEHQNEVRKGDLLFNTSSETPEEVGMCAVMDEKLENVYLNSFCFGFRVTDNNIDPTCVAYMMRSHIGRRIMSILAHGATRYNLSKNSFCKAVLVLPKNIAEQRAIASYFTSLDRQITLHTQRLEKLKQIKAACLDNMFV